MKQVSSRIFIFSILIFFLVPQFARAGAKTFIKEYTYQASEDDSRNSSRVIALREVKRLLLEELGTYLESQTEVKHFQLTKDQITTLTAGIVQAEIIAEKWDGSSYWLKSKITAEPDKVAQSIDSLRKDRDKTKELEAMRQKSDELFRENEKLRKELAAAKDATRDARKAAYDKSIRKLSSADWVEKGTAALHRKDLKSAMEAYNRAIDLDPDNAMAYLRRADLRKDKRLAVQDYNKVLAIEPKDSDIHIVRAWAYMALEKTDLAMREYARAIEKASTAKAKAKAYYERGMHYFTALTGDKNLALQDFNKAIEFDPKDRDAYYYRASVYIRLNRPDLAVLDYGKAIELNPSDVFSRISRGQILVQSAPKLAIIDFNEAVELDPKEYGAYEARASAYAQIENLDLAVRDYTRAIELRAPHGTFLYPVRADLYARMGRHDLALRDYNTLIQMEPDQRSYMDRGKYFAKYGKHDQAIRDFTKAIQMKPEFDAYVERGLSWFKMGKDDLALKDYNTAIGLNYKYPGEAYYNRALLYARQKNAARTLQDVTKAIQLDPFYKGKAAGDPQFEFIRNHPDFVREMGR